MPLVTANAVILQAFPYSETSKILRLLTPEYGVQSVIAKGARRPRSRYGGLLELFTDGVATFYRKENRDLHNLSGFELTHSRQGIGRDLVRFGGASLLTEIVLRTASEQAAPDVFQRLSHALSELEVAPAPAVEGVALAQAWALIGALGFAPSIEHCVTCQAPLPPEADLFFDYAAGGVHCAACGGGAGGGRPLPGEARTDLIRFCAGQTVVLDRTAAHWQLLDRFLAHHLVDAGSLRSLTFLAGATGVR